MPDLIATPPKAAGETCCHRCPAHPDWTPCQRPVDHDREFGHRDSTGPDVQHVWQAADVRRYAGTMASGSGDDPYKTWAPHPDREVEELFLQANRNGYIICQVGNDVYQHDDKVYTLISPDGTKALEFLGRVVASSGIWRYMVNDLRDWLAQTKDEAEGHG